MKNSPIVMYKYKILIAYDGTQYGGWQIQPNAPSIQQTIEDQLQIILKTPTKVIGSGRTDAGVHAKGQVAHFICEQPLDFNKFLYSLNSLLPPDISVYQIELVDDSFHARFSAKGKIYSYHLFLNKFHEPFEQKYYALISKPFDIDAFTQAKRHFIGTHDFKSFANEGHKGSANNCSIRTIHSIDVSYSEQKVVVTFYGNGFLYKMVRNIVGTMIEVATGKIPLNQIEHIFAAKDRRYAGLVAPAKGLFLEKVLYE